MHACGEQEVQRAVHPQGVLDAQEGTLDMAGSEVQMPQEFFKDRAIVLPQGGTRDLRNQSYVNVNTLPSSVGDYQTQPIRDCSKIGALVRVV
jgi:hypothetical protein